MLLYILNFYLLCIYYDFLEVPIIAFGFAIVLINSTFILSEIAYINVYKCKSEFFSDGRKLFTYLELGFLLMILTISQMLI